MSLPKFFPSLLQLPAEINTSGSKTPTTFIPFFTQIVITGADNTMLEP